MRRNLLLVVGVLLLMTGVIHAQDAPTVTPTDLPDAVGNTNALRVTDVLPAGDTTGIDPETVITVIFNRPVVPLRIAEEQDDLPDPLQFSPSVQGEGEWINTSIYQFTPDPALAGGTAYTVTLDPALTAVDGSQFAEPFSWSFETVLPAISETVPTDSAQGVRIDRPIQVRFNQPMDRASVEASFTLLNTSTGENIPGAFEWAEDSAGFSFTPTNNLVFNETYSASFQGTLPVSQSGSAALTDDSAFMFSTVSLPAVVSTDPFDGQTGVPPYGGFRILFASPMDVDTLRDRVVIEPEPLFGVDTYYSDYSNEYYVNFSYEPSTSYTITLLPGMEDIYGNVIQTETVVNFTTAPYSPQVNLRVPDDVGFYNAANEQTRLFLTHMNVSEVDLSLYQIPDDLFVSVAASTERYNLLTNLSSRLSNLIQSWTIPSVAPENALRYELLDLGRFVGVECPGAPQSRLTVGDAAVVITEPDPLRARASAPDGEVVDQLYRDYALQIVGGPVCANGYVWWEVTLRNGSTAWVAEGDTTEYYLEPRFEGSSTPIPLAGADGERLPPGVYYLTAAAPEVNTNSQPLRHVMVVGTANVTIKASVDSAVVWVTNVDTGEPIPNAPVQVFDASGLVAEGVTDGEGLLRVDLPRVEDLYRQRVAVVRTNEHFGVGVTYWTSGIEAWSFGQTPNYYPTQHRAYLYTDRPIYRPDQPVYFRGIVRAQDDVTYSVPDFTDIPVRVLDPEGEVVFDEVLPLNEFGSFSGQFDIADDAPLGEYRLVAQLPGQMPNDYYNPLGSIRFGVAEYRAPEFQVEVTPAQAEVVQGDTITVTVDATYFFGGNVGGANLEYSVISAPYYFEYEGAGSYNFTDFDADRGASEFYAPNGGVVTSGEGVTEADGTLTIEIPADLQDAALSQTFTIEAVVTDESDQAVAGRADVIVHKGEFYVGVAPEQYVATAGEESQINVITVDWDSQPVPNTEVEIEIVEREWFSVQEEDANGRTTWTYDYEETTVATGTVTTDENGRATYSFTPPVGGIYKINARARDDAGNTVISSAFMWVAGENYVSWRQQNSNRIDLITDRSDYEIGDTAEILITSPFQGEVEALISVERGDVLLVEQVTMTSNSYVFELPITEEFAPNVYVTVMLVKGVDENNPVASFRMGMAQIAVETERKVIDLEITPSVEQAGPGDTVTYTVRVTDWQSEPVQAEVGVGLTDLAVLTIADPNSPPLLNFFYGAQGLSVLTSTPLTINTDQITQEVLDTIKGGGGGFGEGGIFDIRQEFVDTPYWNASIITDENGIATFDVVLPDNLTTWRLDARAVTSGEDGVMLVGQDTFDLISTKPVLIRPVTPRFFVVGDEVVMGAVVNNNTDEALDVEVGLEAVGVTPAEGVAMSQTVTVPARGGTRVSWRVTVDETVAVDLTFFANANDGQYTDASKPPLGVGDARLLPVYRYEAPETVGTAGVVGAGESVTEAISLPTEFDVTQGSLDVSLERSLAATTVDGLEYLRNFPHQCIEQTVSRFLPNIITYRALAELGIADAELERNLTQAVSFAVQRLYAQQKADGGWGWYVQDPSNSLVTAYALIGLTAARDQGFTVSDAVITNAQNFLRGSLVTVGLDTANWRRNRQAFVLYALAYSGAPDVARTVNLYEFRDRLNYDARAFLAMTFDIIEPADNRADTLLSDLVNAAAVSASGAHWNEIQVDTFNWSTDTRTTAIALRAFLQIDPDNGLIPNIVRYLVTQRTADAWETTQETAWAVMGLTDWMVYSGELNASYDFTASLNDDTLMTDIASPENVREVEDLRIEVADMLQGEVNRLVIELTPGNGSLYYTAFLNVYLPVPEIEPLDRGIIVSRRYVVVDEDGSEREVTSAQVGDTIEVRLTVIAPNDLHYVMIQDPIPAGTDAVDPNLNTSQQIGTQPELNPENPLAFGWGWWYFSNIEYRDEMVVLYSTYLPAGTYEYVYTIRAGLAGEYNVIPPTAQEFYFPDVYGRGAGTVFTIEG